ncbi:putative Acidic mammalian chitinase [Hypsibius exemplaris]|uniref:Metalloendopeptidase n=1 Tax=Hypsibius exemplaris TaxID=2072580 RepID=A0A9X6NI98_HYPEX|nr:putative Acidic mammalian chitinase [Hypsibius exemplaris]
MPNIIAKEGLKPIGNRVVMSVLDVRRINLLYKCPVSVPTTQSVLNATVPPSTTTSTDGSEPIITAATLPTTTTTTVDKAKKSSARCPISPDGMHIDDCQSAADCVARNLGSMCSDGRAPYVFNLAKALDDDALALAPNASFLEGDIFGVDAPSSDANDVGYNAVMDENLRWISRTVPFAFSSTFESTERDKMELVRTAMDVFEKSTCLKFVQRTNEIQYIQFHADPNRCYSNYGKQIRGTKIGLSIINCFTNATSGIAQHEIMHALGFFHEQSRMDRDQYVDINWSNIRKKDWDQFKIYESTAFNETYDFGSLLHYGMYDFAIEPHVWTIRPKDKYKDKVIGQRNGLSEIDIRKLNKMYPCPAPSTVPNSAGLLKADSDTQQTQFIFPHRGCYYTLAGETRLGQYKFTPDDLDTTLCTYISVAFGVLQDGKIMFSSRLRATLRQLRENSRSNLKLFLTVGGADDSDSLDAIARDASRSNAFAWTTAHELRLSGVDGLDIMYQKKSGVNAATFTAFIKKIHNVFQMESSESDKPQLALSLVVFAETSMTASISAKDLNPLVDIVNVAAYDFAGADHHSLSHHSPTIMGPIGTQTLYNMESLLDHWLKRGFDKSKLVAGLPFYGRGWLRDESTEHELASAALQWITASAYTRERGTWPYYEICQRIKQDGATNFVDPLIQASYAYSAAWWIGYNDVHTIKTKANWARLHGFGVYAWDVSQDDFRNTCGDGKYPLLNAIAQQMKSTSSAK